MKIEVEQGRVVVNDVRIIIDHDDVKVFHVDIRAKYPDGFAFGYGDDDLEVYIFDGEHTLNVDSSTEKTTCVRFTIPGAGWGIIADSSKYSVYICVHRYDAEWRLLWERPRENEGEDPNRN